MKRLTINGTWENCLAMWKWISRQCLGKGVDWCTENVNLLKKRWLFENGFTVGDMENNCFFCEYDTIRRDSCQDCPIKRIEKAFHCVDSARNYETHPRKFYAELRRLNKIRLAKK